MERDNFIEENGRLYKKYDDYRDLIAKLGLRK